MQRICLALGALFVVSLAGCGGGSSSTNPAASKAAVRKQTIKAARVSKSISTAARFGKRAAAAVSLRTRAAHTRDAGGALDQGSGLYYVLTSNADGSGKIDLFTDAALQTTAGAISWPVPDGWTATSQPYPAVLHVTYAITAGTLKGDTGTEDITINDAAGLHDLIHIKLQDQAGGNETADVAPEGGA